LDRRQLKRYSLQIPVVFSWNDANGDHQKEDGLTRDINPTGEFVVSHACPQVDAKIALEIRLPHIPRGDRLLHIHERGTVIRKEDKSRLKNGFAVLNDPGALRCKDLQE
jgi:hypothetical protein